MDEKAILEQVKIRLLHYSVDESNSDVVFNHVQENPLLQQLIKQAISAIKAERHYENNPAIYTEKKIEEDLKRYENNVVDYVVYYRSQAGESFMKSFSENGVSRSWVDSGKLFAGVKAISKIV